MSNETGTAFLVDPMGHEPLALDEEDYKHIKQYLNVKHSANDETAAAIDWLLHLSTEPGIMNDHDILTWMVRHYLSDWQRDTEHGVLVARGKDAEPRALSLDELEILENTLAAIRCPANSWLRDWLAVQVEAIATADDLIDRHPSPLKIAASLVDCIGEYEAKMKAAREMVRMHPHLLVTAPAPPLATPEPPAPEQATQPATSKPATAQRTRKTRKKVKRAA